MTRELAYAIALGAPLLGGVLLPALAMRALVPALERSTIRVANYRGASLPVGLGIVWVVWVLGLLTASTAVTAWRALAPEGGGAGELLYSGYLSVALGSVPALLTLAAFALGAFDDVFGTSAEKGFSGHVSALLGGRLTTGMLKLLGIGLASLIAGLTRTTGWRVWSADGPLSAGWGTFIATWLGSALVIALTANLVNLLDLRPGRALKGYLALVLPAVLLVPAGIRVVIDLQLASLGAAALTPLDQGVLTAALALVFFGPVLAVWGFDLGERAMLGDAGSNAAGAVAGWLYALVLPPTGLGIAALLLLVANLASERVSFSAVIERITLLRWLDGLGRRADAPGKAASEPHSAGESRYDAEESRDDREA